MFDTPFDRYDDIAAAAARDEEDYRFDSYEPIAPVSDSAPAIEQPQVEVQPRRRLLIALILAVAVAAAWWVLRGGTPAPAAMPIPVVTAATPLQEQVTEWDEFVGRFKATKSVEVRPQVSGQIVGVHFTDGQYVRAGAPLFTIDGRTFRAALAQS